MNNITFITTENGCTDNIIILQSRSQILGLGLDLNVNKEASKLINSILVVPAFFFPSHMAQTAENIMLYRILSRVRHYNCNVVIIADINDTLDKRTQSLVNISCR